MRAVGIIRSLILALAAVAATALFLRNFQSPNQQFTWQAISFAEGKLPIEAPSIVDMAHRNGHWYWPEGPFPSVLLLPFVAFFNGGIEQGYLQAALVIIMIVLLYRYTRKNGFSPMSTVYLLTAYIFGSVLIGILTEPSSWYFSQTVAVFLLTILILEWESGRRYVLLGIITAMLLATRPTAALFGGYIVWYMLTRLKSRARTAALVSFLLPVGICIVLLGWFNVSRFGSVLDSGYLTNILTPDEAALRQMGIFSPFHIPRNLYWYFLAGFVPALSAAGRLVFPFVRYNRWGLSVFLVMPFFLYTLRALPGRDPYVRALWIVCAITFGIILMFFNTGADQFGPRYIADFLPLLYILLLRAIPDKTLTEFQKTLIVLSTTLNMYLLWATRVF